MTLRRFAVLSAIAAALLAVATAASGEIVGVPSPPAGLLQLEPAQHGDEGGEGLDGGLGLSAALRSL